MINLNNIKKGQGLPLNTIVIAILVIIVLLVIIVFFTTKMGDTGNTFKKNDPTACADENPTWSALGYKKQGTYATSAECTGTNTKVVNFNTGDSTNKICCVTVTK